MTTERVSTENKVRVGVRRRDGNEAKSENKRGTETGRRGETKGWDEGGKQDGNDGADENENIDNGITNVRE